MIAMREDTIAITLAILVALGTVTGVVIAGMSARSAPEASAPIDPACREWTDGCVVCRREASGRVCSNPGMACLRGPACCLDEPAPELSPCAPAR